MNTPTARETRALSIVRNVLSALADAPADASVKPWKSEINSALHALGEETLLGDNTIGRLRALTGSHPDGVPARYRAQEAPVAHTPVREAEHFCHSLFVTREGRCTARVDEAGVRCGKHDHLPTDADVLARRAEVEAEKEAYRARKQAREMLTFLSA